MEIGLYQYHLNFISFWLCGVFVAVCGFSLVAVTGGYSLVEVCGRLTVMASLVAEHGLWDQGHQ